MCDMLSHYRLVIFDLHILYITTKHSPFHSISTFTYSPMLTPTAHRSHVTLVRVM